MTRIAVILVVGLLMGWASAHAQACSVNAGPIFNQSQANTVCPTTCTKGSYGPWTGQWWTTQPNVMSVCQCGAINESFNAGPLANQQAADATCPSLCQNNQGTWTGQWWTTQPGVMSVCQCAVCTPPAAAAAKKPQGKS